METLTPRRFFAILILAITLFSVAAEGVGATALFDGRVILDWKANPALKAALPDILQNSQTKVSVIVVFSSIPSSEQLHALQGLGRIRTFTGHVATIDVDPTSLEQLAALSFVDRIAKPRTLKSELDVSVPDILADQVWNEVRDPDGNPVDGSGVVVGIVDSGIDYLHKDFMLRNGTTKILYIWDQSVDGKPPSAFNYGNECSPIDIQSQTCSEVDGGSNGQEPGHGTAVAAVAASTGQATSGLDSCLLFEGTRWFDETSKCQATNVKPFPVLLKPNDYLYFGSVEQFSKIFFDLATGGSYETLTWEYSRGSGSWAKLPNDTITVDSQELSFVSKADGTAGLSRNGTFAFAPPVPWKPDTVNGVGDMYWLRLSAQEVGKPATANRILRTPSYVGVVPGASIVAVKLKSGSEDHVLDGMNYVIQKAREVGRPLVIDHSLGDSLGSHDGTEPLEIAMTDLAQDGVPIVVAAGNSRNLNLHARGKLSPGQSMTVYWSINQYERGSYIDLWYPVSDNVGISVKTPSGVSVFGPTDESGVITPDGNVQILIGERSSGNEWWISITSAPGRDLQTTPWSFTLTGSRVTEGKWDAWVEPGQFTLNATSLYIIDPQDTIDYPGTARGVITVGSYMTRLFWRSGCSACIAYSLAQGKHGIWWTTPPAPDDGALTYSSSMGPTRDGRMKPELVAPGAQIIAARASTRQQKYSDPDNYHQVWRGTSFSAPHVVGVIAMMLQMNPYLTPNEIKTILTQDARQDKFTGEIDRDIGSPLWGWGKVNALASTEDAPTLYSVRLQIEAEPGDFIVNLNLDGESAFAISLNQTNTLILEFRRGGTHTIELAPHTIQISPGVRYVASGTPWEFSSGGIRKFDYQLQYYLEVTSPYGYATGTGWYGANTTTTAGVYPLEVPGFHFQGWTGSVTSPSSSIQVTMNSEKRLVARWAEDRPMMDGSVPLNVFLVVALVVIGIASLVMLFKTGRVNLLSIRRNDAARRFHRLLSES